MKKRIAQIALSTICLSLVGYYALIFASNKLSENADFEMNTIASTLKAYVKVHNTFPKDMNAFLAKGNLSTKIQFWPFATEIKIYLFEDGTCTLEYYDAPFGPLKGAHLNQEELYYAE